jgi:hypothetical protein
MLTKEQREKKAMIESIKTLEIEIRNKTQRRNELLLKKTITPIISSQINEIDKKIFKKNKQLTTARKKLAELERG